MAAGTGSDDLSGGAGDHSMTGGAGDDSFVFAAMTDLGSAAGCDVIVDFTSGDDKIDLTALHLTFQQRQHLFGHRG